MIHKIYFFAILILTVIVIYYYYISQRDYIQEVQKISQLEAEQILKDNELAMIRSRTISCPISGLNDPRSCYFGSNYNCTWNELAQRCDKK